MTTNPTTWPSRKQFAAWAREATQGTLVAATSYMPIDSFDPEFKYTWLDNQALYGDMAQLHGRQQGVEVVEWQIDGPMFMDQIPFFIANLLGDITSSGAAPVSHAMSLLNSGQAQPGSLSLYHWQGAPTATGVKAYAGSVVNEITISGDAESSFVTVSIKGMSWAETTAGAAPTFTASTLQPQAAWRYLLGIGGPASGGSQDKTVQSFTVTLSRTVKPKYTLQGLQTPYTMQRAEVTVSGSLTCTVPANDNIYQHLITNDQPQMQILGSVGAGATAFGLQIDLSLAAWDTAKVNTSEESVGYDIDFVGVSNSTNAGASGGTSPVKVTVTNQTAAGSYT